MPMYHPRSVAITIPLDTWLAKRDHLMERFGHLREQDLRFTPGQEDALVQRLQTLLFMARRAVLDLLRGA